MVPRHERVAVDAQPRLARTCGLGLGGEPADLEHTERNAMGTEQQEQCKLCSSKPIVSQGQAVRAFGSLGGAAEQLYTL